MFSLHVPKEKKQHADCDLPQTSEEFGCSPSEDGKNQPISGVSGLPLLGSHLVQALRSCGGRAAFGHAPVTLLTHSV